MGIVRAPFQLGEWGRKYGRLESGMFCTTPLGGDSENLGLRGADCRGGADLGGPTGGTGMERRRRRGMRREGMRTEGGWCQRRWVWIET